MNTDTAEQARPELIKEIASGEREVEGCKAWTTEQLRQEFEVMGFMAPFVVVRNRKTGKMGSLEFCHSPRLYFSYMEDAE